MDGPARLGEAQSRCPHPNKAEIPHSYAKDRNAEEFAAEETARASVNRIQVLMRGSCAGCRLARTRVRGGPVRVAGGRYAAVMTAQPDRGRDPAGAYEVIHLGGEAAAIVPLAELQRLRAVERHASLEALEEAEIETTLAAHDEWVAAGCPGALSHEEVMAELLRSNR